MPRLSINCSVVGRMEVNAWDTPHVYGDTVSVEVDASIDFLKLSKDAVLKSVGKAFDKAIADWESKMAEELSKQVE